MVGEERFYELILLLAQVQLCDDFCKTQFSGAPNESKVQNHLNIALLNYFSI